jgi:hypothetical protein
VVLERKMQQRQRGRQQRLSLLFYTAYKYCVAAGSIDRSMVRSARARSKSPEKVTLAHPPRAASRHFHSQAR